MVTASTMNQRLLRDPGKVTSIPAPANTMINEGDLIWNNSGIAAVCSTTSWGGSTGATQETFRSEFLGVSNTSRRSTDPSTNGYITTIGDGIFTFPCTALGSAEHIGAFVAPDKDTGITCWTSSLLLLRMLRTRLVCWRKRRWVDQSHGPVEVLLA